MSELKTEINGINIFEHDYDRWKNHEECNSLISNGVVYRFYKFLRWYGLIDEYETVEGVDRNLSACRDGNRYDIHDNYRISWDDEYDNLEISYLYVVNGNVWGVLLEKSNGTESWYGDFEIPGNL